MLDLLKSILRINMIKSLYIKNYILIDELEIDFSGGFTVFTGETGAGKSIIVGALSLLLGERADTKVIGPFNNQAEIIACFDVGNNNEARHWLDENELANDDELQLRRTLNNEGRSRLWINGRPSNASMVRQLGQSLVQIHGQHDQVRLLKSTEQLKILDASASYVELLQQTRQTAANWHDLNKQLQELYEAGSLSNEQSQLLEYQYEELENLNLSATEYEQLHQDLQTATHAVDLEVSISQALDTLKDNDSSVQLSLNQLISKLQQTRGYDFTSVCQMLSESVINIDEAYSELSEALTGIDSDPASQQQIENRLDQIYQVARKQKITPEQLHDHFLQLQATLKQHASQSEHKTSLQQALDLAMNKYQNIADKLSIARKTAAQSLAGNICKLIHTLGLPEAELSIEVEPTNHSSPNVLGNDKVEFMIAINKGQPFQALSKTASGGELSRISLAIEVCNNAFKNHSSFVFDEVDTGVGGATAEMIGQMMFRLGDKHQIFTVTHLPQVAGQANQHLLVRKKSKAQYTVSSLQELNHEQRIQELARMSGGQNITEATLAQAREFLKTA